MKFIIAPKNIWEKWLVKWSQIKCEFNGPVMIKVEQETRSEMIAGQIYKFRDKITPILKWYRFSFVVTHRFMEDYGEGAINGGFPRRYKRGWHDFDTDSWIWYIMPFHLIIPGCKLFKIWFYWKVPLWMEDKQRELNPSIEVIENLKNRIREEEWQRSFKFYESKQPLFIRIPENHEN